MRISPRIEVENLHKEIRKLLRKIEFLESQVRHFQEKERSEAKQDVRKPPAPYWAYDVLTEGRIAIGRDGGLRIKSASGQWWRINVSDLGAITTTSIPSPFD